MMNDSGRSGQNSGRQARRRSVLSQTIIIDCDYAQKSDQAETAILHHDIIHNPDTAFHFELNWIGTAGRCIDDLLQHWARAIEKYGLRLVEAYVDPILDASSKNVFQSCFPIHLAIAPPVVKDLESLVPPGTSITQYFEYALLRKFGYVLDIEAGGNYPPSVDVFYSYRRAAFRHSQFVHRSGLAFVQIIGGKEGFRWMTNRLFASSNGFMGGHTRSGLTPHEKADVLRRELHAFCTDATKVANLYAEVEASLSRLRKAT